MNISNASLPCQHTSQSFCMYENNIHVLSPDSNSVTEVNSNRSSIKLAVKHAQSKFHYMTKCGHAIISVTENSNSTGNIIGFVKEDQYMFPKVIMPKFVIPIDANPKALAISPNERCCIVYGIKDGCQKICIYEMDLCSPDSSINFRMTLDMPKFLCSFHYNQESSLKAISASNSELAVLMKNGHLALFSLDEYITCTKVICLKVSIQDLPGNMTSMCWFSGEKLLLATNSKQVFEYDIGGNRFSKTISFSEQSDDTENDDVILHKVRLQHSNNSIFIAHDTSSNILCLFGFKDQKLKILKKVNLRQMIKKDFNNWAIETLDTHPTNGFCHILLHAKDLKIYEVVSFNILQPQVKQISMKYLDLKLHRPQMTINWNGSELLLIDRDGHIKGYRMPVQDFSLSHMVKNAAQTMYRKADIANLNIPKILKEFLSLY